MRTFTALVVLLVTAGCVTEEPARKPLPRAEKPRAAEQRRARPVTTPGPVGSLGKATYYVELEKETRHVLVEEDDKRRAVGHAYLPGPAVRGFVDEDLVVVATVDTVVCYDARRHEVRWTWTPETGRQVDDFVRRGDRLDVALEGGATVTLDLGTGRRSVP